MSEYVCDLSGVSAPDAALVTDDASDDLGLDELPVGWVRVQIARRVFNQEYRAILAFEDSLVAGQLASFPADSPEDQKVAAEKQLRIGAKAMTAALKAVTPKYLTVVEEVIVATPEHQPKVLEAFVEATEKLGFSEEQLGEFLAEEEIVEDKE